MINDLMKRLRNKFQFIWYLCQFTLDDMRKEFQISSMDQAGNQKTPPSGVDDMKKKTQKAYTNAGKIYDERVGILAFSYALHTRSFQWKVAVYRAFLFEKNHSGYEKTMTNHCILPNPIDCLLNN